MSEEGDKPFGKRAVFDCSEHLPPEPSSPEDREFQRILLAIFNNINISIQISLLNSFFIVEQPKYNLPKCDKERSRDGSRFFTRLRTSVSLITGERSVLSLVLKSSLLSAQRDQSRWFFSSAQRRRCSLERGRVSLREGARNCSKKLSPNVWNNDWQSKSFQVSSRPLPILRREYFSSFPRVFRESSVPRRNLVTHEMLVWRQKSERK